MSDTTILVDSNLGKRLDKIRKQEKRFLSYKGNMVPLIAKITLGRNPNNDIVIDDPLASRNHAIIQKIKSEYFIKDLNSSNGTFVNNKEIPKDKYLQIQKNDVIRIGRIEMNMS
jgi:pSer/pThr/pTyr-binding forkhead associated (FHA) protein